MKIVADTDKYVWGDKFTKELRERLIEEIIACEDRDETLEELKDKSDSDIFLIWLRA